jgi:hypothetical protein
MTHPIFEFMAITQSTSFVSKFVAITLALCLVGIMAFWASKLLAPRVAVAPVVVSAPPTDNQESAFTKQLFGNAPSTATAATLPADSRLQVLGVIASSSGVAVVSIDGAAAKSFTIGQTIAQGVVLTQVKSDKIVVRRDGVEQTLPAPIAPSKSILTAGKVATAGSSSSAYPPVMGASNANQTLTGVGGQPQTGANPMQPAPQQTIQSQNQPFLNGQGQPSAQNSDQSAQPNGNNNQTNPIGSSMRSGSPQ